jgi:hypothetical protein
VKIIVEVIQNFSEEEQLVINNINNLSSFFAGVLDKRVMGQYKGFAKHITNHIDEYGDLWLTWTNSNSLEEFEYITNEINLIHNGYIIEVISTSSRPDCQFKYNPGRPKIDQISF